MNKELVVIYNASSADKSIFESDYEQFFLPLKNNPNFQNNGITLDVWYCPSSGFLLEKLETLLSRNNSEIFLHFSGHGEIKGIEYGEWLLKNENLASQLNDSKIKFCFFSCCQSGNLVELVNEKNIPVIIGTAGKNNIENKFAIEFQQRFYSLLLAKESFHDAFEKSIAKIEEEKQKILNKGKHRKITFSLSYNYRSTKYTTRQWTSPFNTF